MNKQLKVYKHVDIASTGVNFTKSLLQISHSCYANRYFTIQITMEIHVLTNVVLLAMNVIAL